jgi:hypothetical protein
VPADTDGELIRFDLILTRVGGPSGRAGDPGVLGELVEVAVGGAEVHPGVAAGIGRWLQEELDPGRAQLGGRGLEVVDQEPGHRPVVKWRLIGLVEPKTSTL